MIGWRPYIRSLLVQTAPREWVGGLDSKAALMVARFATILVFMPGSQAIAALPQETGGQEITPLSAEQLFVFADRARDSGNIAAAEAAYRALFNDSSIPIRNEARFRLAKVYLALRRLPECAILLREILDEQPSSQPVRLALAHVLELLGDDAGARRAVRDARAGDLPAEVVRFVDRYSAALRARKPLGASIDLALAPDSNINRATRSSMLGTVFGEFVLDSDARQQSGIGLAIRGQAFARQALGSDLNLLARISGSADLYRDSQFSDATLGVSLGPEFISGKDRLTVEVGGQSRWYGNEHYARMASVGASLIHPLDATSQLRTSVSGTVIDNRFNDFLDGQLFSGTVSYERSFSVRSGIGLAASIERQSLRDSGYSTTGGQVAIFGYRDFGAVTAIATVAHARLEADERLMLYLARRSDRLFRASLAANFRNLRFGSLAPFLRVTLERNLSSVEIYDYRRLRSEIGLTRAF